jgi:hypothetical protein
MLSLPHGLVRPEGLGQLRKFTSSGFSSIHVCEQVMTFRTFGAGHCKLSALLKAYIERNQISRNRRTLSVFIVEQMVRCGAVNLHIQQAQGLVCP